MCLCALNAMDKLCPLPILHRQQRFSFASGKGHTCREASTETSFALTTHSFDQQNQQCGSYGSHNNTKEHDLGRLDALHTSWLLCLLCLYSPALGPKSPQLL